MRMCRPHTVGVQPYLQGKRWQSPGCPKCAERIAAGEVSADDPTPKEIWRREYKNRSAVFAPGGAKLQRQWRAQGKAAQ